MNLLLLLVLATVLGWWVGGRRPFGETTLRVGQMVMLAAVGALVFGMGLSLGQRPDIVSQMARLGLRAVSLSLSGAVGAIIAVATVRRLWRERRA